MSVIERLERDYEDATAEVKRLRELADELTVKADRERRTADALELEAVGSRAAANLLRQNGFSVDRDPVTGYPTLHVDPAASEKP